MKKNAWNWVTTIVLVFAGATIANAGYVLWQEGNLERGDWGWFLAGQVGMIIVNLRKIWDDASRGRRPPRFPDSQ
ncbi:MAG: hypothetical protein OXQ86_08105 [Gammaproteobacteria bacterium]|nr:hypothetical protein [Gammaproteobacteria bacterium]MDE0412889.1 hypothetical protein [Gammaproteobacteria bacterium]